MFTILLSKDEILYRIKNYPNHNWIWVEIWEMSEYEVQIVVTVNKEEMCHLADHIVIHACSASTDTTADISELKSYGKSLVRLLRRQFSESRVRSNLRYN